MGCTVSANVEEARRKYGAIEAERAAAAGAGAGSGAGPRTPNSPRNLTDTERLMKFSNDCATGKKADVQKALQQGGIRSLLDFFDPKTHSNTPLHRAAANGQAEITRILLRAGAKVDSRNSENYTPLIYASKQGHLDCVNALIKAGANVDLVEHLGNTALLWAVEQLKQNQPGNFKDVIQALLEAGADPDIPNKAHRMPSRLAPNTISQFQTQCREVIEQFDSAPPSELARMVSKNPMWKKVCNDEG